MAKEDNTPNPIPEEDFDPSQTTYDDDKGLYDPDDPLHEQEYTVIIIEKEK